jgi:hypothetical protein
LFTRISATRNVLNYGTIPLGALLAGVLAERIGIAPALWSMTALYPLSALLFLILGPLRRYRELPVASPAQPPAERRTYSSALTTPAA